MKKLAVLITSMIFLYGCSVSEFTSSDGTKYTMLKSKWDADFTECKMDEFWYGQVEFNKPPTSAIADCYERRPVYQLCNDWDYVYQEFYHYEEVVMLLRNSISQALIRKNEDALKCRNPNNDAIVKAKIEVDIAKQKAANAEARAAAAKRKAQKTERCLRLAEAGKVKSWSCN